ncbi:MAG: diacylglycerol/lipid kinase family protein [Gemmatimonadaceae bacterium]
MTTRACLIANPTAGRGRGARLLPRVAQAFAACGITDVRLTTAPGDEARQVRAALDAGCETIAVLGGDGTWSKAAAELARRGSPARLALLSAGTGNDFVKNLPDPSHDPEAMARLVAGDGVERRIDMAAVDDRWFLNVAGFAFDVAVLERTQRMRWLGGSAVYAAAALRELFGYSGLEVRLDGELAPSRYLLLAFANGAHFGGAFHVAPGARVDDGLLDAIAIPDVGVLARPALLARAARGTHLDHPRVTARRAAAFTLHFAAPPLYEADGELQRAASTDVRVESRPGVLRVLAAREG